SVEDIYSVVHQRLRSISLDTVYRTVDTFSNLGVVKRFMAADGRYRFDINLDQHQHLVCMKCGRIEDVHIEGLDRLAIPHVAGWSDIALGDIEIKGLCSRCRRR
ncbi:transcriptional repressor, partial [candidate division GN15 bacterium]|nr:transcriptional repressor [candidate division GN15 bacterium]